MEPVSGREVIVEILRNMRECGEQLYYSTLVPTTYEVYLYPDEFRRLESAREAIAREARQALAEQLERLNREGWLDQLRSRLGVPRRPREVAADSIWRIEILADPDGTLAPGDVRVVSSLGEAVPPDFEGGQRTERIFATTRHRPAREREAKQHGPPVPEATSAVPARPLATLTWEDDHGAQSYSMERPNLVIGRGGAGYWVDVKLQTVPDVSREHVRLRHAGQFFIKDVSRLGTTVNGEAIPPTVEVPLPPRARIGLAGRLFLEFRAE